MSVDTSLASSPISTDDAEGTGSTPSAWDTLRLHLDAERAIKAAAERRSFGPTAPLTAAELRIWIAKYDDWLGTQYVQNHGALKDWVEGRRDKVQADLDALTGGAK